MRWDHLKRDPDAETAALPGMTDPAVVRRFDAPEALDTRFYEIEAKTVLNRVPSRSNMPFGWTVNPYRGCSHACTYCLAPDTPVLMADGTTRAIGALEPGDAIYGTRRDGTSRRYVETTVKDRWPTRKPAFTVRLEDGTELVASGDHRFLTARGWKHVTNAPEPGAQRPHLTVGMRLLGPGGFVDPPDHDHDAIAGAVRTAGGPDTTLVRQPSLTGREIQNAAPLRVVSIEPAGTLDLVDITTGTGDFIANGVISHNCFARPTHEYLNFNPGRDFEREIVVKVNAPERLRADLARRARTAAWGDTVALGTNTDPYQWVESKYRLLPGIWEALRDERVPASVLTKSPLLLRDQKLMLEIQAAAGFEAALSIPSLDEKAWRSTEPHTPHPRTRIAAVAELTRIGIPTAVLVAPLMPGINDAPEQVEKLLAACTDAGAISVRGLGLHLRGSTRDVFLEWLGGARPDLVPVYEELYRHGPHLPRKEAHRLSQLVQQGERWGERVVRSDRARRATNPGASAPPSGRFDPLPLVPAAARPGARAQVSNEAAPPRPRPATPAGGATQDVIAVGPPESGGRAGSGPARSTRRPHAAAGPREAPAPPEDQLSLF
jgi:DNA repair photolyase